MNQKNIVIGRITTFCKCLLASYLLTGVLLVILAMGLYKLHFSESIVKISVIVIYVLSAFLTGFLMGKIQKTKKFLWGALMGLIYFFVLVIISLAVNHSLRDVAGNFLTTMMICGGSGMLGGMLG